MASDLFNTIMQREVQQPPQGGPPAGGAPPPQGGMPPPQPPQAGAPMPPPVTPSVPTKVPPQAERWENAQQLEHAYANHWSPNPLLLRTLLNRH